MPDPYDAFAAAAEAGAPLFAALDRLSQGTLGHKLFSCSRFRMEEGVAARVYTSDEAHYPTSGLKDVVPNRWTDAVIGRGETFVANSVEGFADVFPDHALIASLGLGSVVNLPVVLNGRFLGTVNLLHGPGHYTPDRLACLPRLKLPAMLAFALT